MKNRKERIMKKLSDLLTGSKRIKAKKLYRKLVDFVVLGTLWFVIVILCLYVDLLFEYYLSFTFLTSANFFKLFLLVPGAILTNKYCGYVQDLRKHRDIEEFDDT